MSTMTARLQAMIAQLDDMLEDDRVWKYPMTPSAIEECHQAMDQIESAKSTTVEFTIGESMDAGDIRDWVEAFFQHPERIEVKQFKVTK